MLNKFLIVIVFIFVMLSSVTVSHADLTYDPQKSKQMTELESVDSVRMTTEYLCGNSALFISASATESEINGRFASITGKIVTGEISIDITPSINGAIMSSDILESGLNVRCNRKHGAFRLVFSPGQVFKGKPEDRHTITSIEVYSDGTVIGSRSRRKQAKTAHHAERE